MVTTSRKGASRVADVPADVLRELNAGRIEAATLAENLATDFAALLTQVLPELSDDAAKLDSKAGITKRMAGVAALIHKRHGAGKLDFLTSHPSDLVRGWGAYLLASLPELTLESRIAQMRPFAVDHHFGVREWSWLALRPYIVAAPEESIEILRPWTGETSEYLRRFAVEAIRPRGVWSAHIPELKSDPSLALSLLEPVRSDPSRYVQDSVANWLNDAWKSQPNWVEQLCEDWLKQSSSEATSYIAKRALRNQKR
ncbi:DNA alkylation repair protein [Pseudovibrio denitrificans]|uniref:DNA alkylation repair protein n=1 Tax=Pseudovibrio denitrificans TaxID=258256 RepID=UPI0039BF5ECD